jgi:hypothetical protein
MFNYNGARATLTVLYLFGLGLSVLIEGPLGALEATASYFLLVLLLWLHERWR